MDSYRDWRNVTWYAENVTDAVPLSCCSAVGGCGNIPFIKIANNGGIVDNTPVWSQVTEILKCSNI